MSEPVRCERCGGNTWHAFRGTWFEVPGKPTHQRLKMACARCGPSACVMFTTTEG